MAKKRSNTISKKNVFIIIITLVCFLLFAATLSVCILTRFAPNNNTEIENVTEYKIVVSDNLTIYDGDEQQLTPRIIDSNGSVLQGRFSYAVKDADAAPIAISESGVITVKENSEAISATVEITELNTLTKTNIKIAVERELSGIKGVVFGDDLVVATDTQELTFGNEYTVTVKTIPSQAVLKDEQLSIKTVDKYGKEVDGVLEYSVVPNTNKIKIRTTGLGAGTMVFSVTANGKELCKDEKYNFSVAMQSETLNTQLTTILKNAMTDDVVAREKIELIPFEIIAAEVKTLEIFENVETLHGVNKAQFPALETIVLNSTRVIALNDESVCNEIVYRVHKNVIEDYLENDFWTKYKQNIIPYENDAMLERWLVYHYSETINGENIPKVQCVQIVDGFSLSNFTDKIYGYQNDYFYIGADPKPQSYELKQQCTDDVLEKIAETKSGLHIMAGYSANPYSVKYIVSQVGEDLQNVEFVDNKWRYDERRELYTLENLAAATGKEIAKTGYVLSGWHTEANPNIVFKVGEAQLNLIDKGTVTLYADWTPIQYRIICQNGTDKVFQTVAYDETFTLGALFNNVTKTGHEIDYFEDRIGNKISAADELKNLMSQSGEYTITVSFKPIKYTIKFEKDGGNWVSVGAEDIKEMTYGESYKVPLLVKTGKKGYEWKGVDSMGNVIDGMTFASDGTIFNLADTPGTITLKAFWDPVKYSIKYLFNNFSYRYQKYEGNIKIEQTVNNEYTQDRIYGDKAKLITPTRTGYSAYRWKALYYMEEDSSLQISLSNVYYDLGDVSDLISGESAEHGRIYVLRLESYANAYSVSFNYNGATSTGSSSKSVTYDSTYGTLPTPKKTGYSFEGWYTSNNQRVTESTWVQTASNHTLSARWQYRPLTITYTTQNGDLQKIPKGQSESIKVNISGGSGSYSFTPTTGSGDGFSWTFDVSQRILKVSVSKQDKSGAISIKVTDNNYGSTANIYREWSSENSCVTEGTMIKLADGSQKKIEDLNVGDVILTWNFKTGKIEAQPITIFWNHGKSEYDIINLKFADNTLLRLVGQHGVFDLTTNQFEHIDAENYKNFIGHKFATVSDSYSEVELIDAYVTKEFLGSYSLETAQNGNAIAEGMLTLTPQDFVELFMFAEVGDNLKFNEDKLNADIEKYGLYSYEEWQDYVTEEQFNAFNGQYMKIIVGKGIATEEQLLEMISKWLKSDLI